jgi:hypothetical protein
MDGKTSECPNRPGSCEATSVADEEDDDDDDDASNMRKSLRFAATVDVGSKPSALPNARGEVSVDGSSSSRCSR